MNYADVSVRFRVTEELETMDRGDVVEAVEILWNERSAENLGRVLERIWPSKFKKDQD